MNNELLYSFCIFIVFAVFGYLAFRLVDFALTFFFGRKYIIMIIKEDKSERIIKFRSKKGVDFEKLKHRR